MPDPKFADLARQHTLEGLEIPQIARALAGGSEPELVWRNELDGLTFRIGDRYLKWNPRSTGIDLDRERVRLGWISARHPAPRVVDYGSDGDAQWLLTEGVPGGPAVGDEWRARRDGGHPGDRGRAASHPRHSNRRLPGRMDRAGLGRAAAALAWQATIHRRASRRPRRRVRPKHADLEADGVWTGNVDFGDLAIGDRWADLAVASMSLDWNFGEGHQREFFDAYGIAPDKARIGYYRSLWHLES